MMAAKRQVRKAHWSEGDSGSGSSRGRTHYGEKDGADYWQHDNRGGSKRWPTGSETSRPEYSQKNWSVEGEWTYPKHPDKEKEEASKR